MDENIIQINLVEVASELAELDLVNSRDLSKYPQIDDLLVEEDNGGLHYKEEVQDEFNMHYDYWYNLLEKYKL